MKAYQDLTKQDRIKIRKALWDCQNKYCFAKTNADTIMAFDNLSNAINQAAKEFKKYGEDHDQAGKITWK